MLNDKKFKKILKPEMKQRFLLLPLLSIIVLEVLGSLVRQETRASKVILPTLQHSLMREDRGRRRRDQELFKKWA